MLEVQKFLRQQSLDALSEQLGIKVNQHDTLPLVILNYDQIESPKTHPIVRECRGLVLHTDSLEVVARSFRRFFNWGEVAEEMEHFNFSDFTVQSKEDGSLALLYHFGGEWRMNTRGSFAQDNIQFQNFTWVDGVCQALDVKSLQELEPVLNSQFTYVCEFVSPWNKIVRKYDKPAMYLLAMFDRDGTELSHAQCDGFAHAAGMLRPTLYEFKSIEEIQDFLHRQAEQDPTFEGVVMCDDQRRRWKIKSSTYLGLHKLKGEGDNMYNPKHLLPFVLAGEEAELLTYFPEVRGRFFEVKAMVTEAYGKVLEAWLDHSDEPDRKSFALAVGKRPFSGLLFSMRDKQEKGEKVSGTMVRKLWRESSDAIVKTLLKT